MQRVMPSGVLRPGFSIWFCYPPAWGTLGKSLTLSLSTHFFLYQKNHSFSKHLRWMWKRGRQLSPHSKSKKCAQGIHYMRLGGRRTIRELRAPRDSEPKRISSLSVSGRAPWSRWHLSWSLTDRISAGSRKSRESQQRESEPEGPKGSDLWCLSGKPGQGRLWRPRMPTHCGGNFCGRQ